jgi:2'-5' RNA ligase
MSIEPKATGTGRRVTGRRHWRGRPGWHTGQDFYACFLTLEDQPELRGLIRRYQDSLRGMPHLDLIAPRWLHITMQGIGFADDISPAGLAAVTQRIGERLRGMHPPAVTFHRPTIRPAAVFLTAEPAGPLYEMRLAIHRAVASATGPGQFDEPAPEPGRFVPHVSIAYASGDGPAPPVAEALRGTAAEAVTATFRTASLLVFRRDRHEYGWTSATSLPVGA